MEKWIHDSLSGILDFPVPQDLTQFILQIQDERDLDEYLKDFLDCSNPKHRQFITDLKKRQASYKDQNRQKKTNDIDTVTKKQKDKKKNKDKKKENTPPQEIVKPEKIEKKKTKFVNLYSQEGRDRATVLLKGRHKCNCEAKKHSLINNCLNCGRIVCIQEGSGPCFFCGNLVCSPDEQSILDNNTKQSRYLYNKLMDQKPSKDFEESLKQRDKLLEYDRNSAQRTKVIDDESDYYQSNNIWLSAEEREKLQKLEEKIHAQKHTLRSNRKITLDFVGREVVEEEEESVNEYNEEQLDKELYESIPFHELDQSNVCPSIEFDRPTYIEQGIVHRDSKQRCNVIKAKSKIQDKEYLEITDEGFCLSLHQPFASLLVSGIKLHEGRSWYTSHRGRLWIAAAAATPTQQEISTIELQYRVLKNEKIQFPANYPTSCLLGCVTIVDVLPQEEYRKVYPDGECSDPYVFICENFYMLPIKFPVQGKHKIYKLDKKIHQAALKCLEKVMKGKGS